MEVPAVRRVLISEERVRERVAELAAEISADYPPGTELLLVGVLRGAFIFLADLARRLTLPTQIDFISLQSYGRSTEPSGSVRLVMDLRVDIAGRDVLIVEDIVDSGHTLAYLRRLLEARGARSLRLCSLLRKKIRARVEAPVEYLGFDIDDEWVVGYGLDYCDMHRALPYIGVVEPQEEPS